MAQFVQKRWKRSIAGYMNIELFGDEEKQDTAVLVIKQGLVDHTLVVDPEINLAATLIRLGRL